MYRSFTSSRNKWVTHGLRCTLELCWCILPDRPEEGGASDDSFTTASQFPCFDRVRVQMISKFKRAVSWHLDFSGFDSNIFRWLPGEDKKGRTPSATCEEFGAFDRVKKQLKTSLKSQDRPSGLKAFFRSFVRRHATRSHSH